MGKIYTRKGDLGMSSLFSGEKVSKDDIRLEAYGALDELQAHLGMARALTTDGEIQPILAEVERGISVACSELASSPEVRGRLSRRLSSVDTGRLESCIDSFTARFPLPRYFILPGRSTDSASLHIARTVCRRAERLIVRVNRELGSYDEVLVYFNRLSDLLFVLAWSLEVMAVVDNVARDVLSDALN